MQKNNSSTQCSINIVNDTTPVFVINNLCTNTLTSSVCAKVMNTITLPSVQFSLFNDDELSNLQGKDVFFIQDIDQSEIVTTSTERLLAQVQPYCRISKIINLSNFINVNSIDSNVDTVNLFDVRKSFNIDDSSFRDLLIYFANFDENDLGFTLEAYAQNGFDIDEVRKLVNCHSFQYTTEDISDEK